MNDYSAVDGSFKPYDYVHVSRIVTETGYVFECSCQIYRTLLDGVGNLPDGAEVLDVGEGVKCIHCRLLKDDISPLLNKANESTETADVIQTQLFSKVKDSLEGVNSAILPLIAARNSKKFSVCLDGNCCFAGLSFNTTTNKYIISCQNGYCKSHAGAKRNVDNLTNSSRLCEHLKAIRQEPIHWEDLVSNATVDNNEEDEEDGGQTSSMNDQTEPLLTELEENNIFDPVLGLWKFPAKSSHCPRKENDEHLAAAIQERDTWNDRNPACVPRINGCLQGPNLGTDVPSELCPCGAGWTDPDHPDSCTKQTSRYLTIYTEHAPVRCNVVTKICLGGNCCVYWDEGESMAVHVLSAETAAGDEIGWSFVQKVMTSKETFSSFCQNMTATYKRRCPTSRGFMDPSVFIKWWFGWASNMKIDFRKPCPVCKFTPKQLACDGTRVGVGFRNAAFKAVETVDDQNTVHQTPHKRMNRCFIVNAPGVEKHLIQSAREHLRYLACFTLNELPDGEILADEVLHQRNDELFPVLPADAIPSLRRFVGINNQIMDNAERVAFADVLKMCSTTAPVSSLLPNSYCHSVQSLIEHLTGVSLQENGDVFFNTSMEQMRHYSPEIRNLIASSMACNTDLHGALFLHPDIAQFIMYLIQRVNSLEYTEPEPAIVQPGTYNPPKYGRRSIPYINTMRHMTPFGLRKFKLHQSHPCRYVMVMHWLKFMFYGQYFSKFRE